MAARAMWKGTMTCDDLEVPVKLYSAIEDRNIHFHLLHEEDLTRVEQRMVHPETDETVPYAATRRGLEVSANKLVMLTQEELDELEPEASREIALEAFLPEGEVDHAWYDRPYYLGPDGDADEYFALAESLAATERQAIARWVMRGKRYVGTLIEQEGYLMLITLRHEGEVINTADLTPPTGRELPAKERKLAEQLVEALEEKQFHPDAYHDTYRESLEKLIAKKSRGETIEVEERKAPAESGSLAKSLEASLKAMRRRSR
jgi:DNA end-binding protein Ku